MIRQLFLGLFLIFTLVDNSLAKPPTHQTYVVPSTQEENIDKKELDEKTLTDEGLDTQYIPKTIPRSYSYHLPPRPSVTVLFSRTYDFSATEDDGWLGIHISPTVKPTSRWQYGLDVHGDVIWLQAAWQKLLSRNQSRFYFGPSVSIFVPVEEELRPFLKLKNYLIGGVGGWEYQLQQRHSLRLEAIFYLGTENSLIKGSIGYTYLL